MDYNKAFEAIVEQQLARVERMKSDTDFIRYQDLDQIIIGVIGGDGIGPAITAQARRVLEQLLADEIKAGKVVFKTIDGCTIENRAAAGKAIPDDVLAEIKTCNVLLKGPTTTPRKGDKWANVESANVAMRKELDLFANVRPVKVPELGIDWTFFRENTECLYAMGSQGLNISDDLAIDFRVITTPGTERIARLAFEYAKNNNKKRVTIVTKANVVKTTDGKFLDVCKQVAGDYPDIEVDDWYIDIMTAKLIDEKRRGQFEVLILPNLYGDILTDEAAEFQGGVGTAGSANLGKQYSMFEAIHGSAPRMVEEGRDIYADPCSVIRAGAMLLSHIGYQEKADRLFTALEECTIKERKLVITGRPDGATGAEFADYILSKI
ncbi:isocitrate/isopropylmalate family dehydrogenase [Sinanaerobacter chloroacetimidivorans]|uniref:Isocitrate/isopropylmalate dehydrogenase family protein n=1 Tax=Sinanaerobacter chloroacetimidivorans TaxID=2818044 RepID=A0A8J7W112_9FIRM|nr:isocitrate/isopropylmalate family dehydrogenase [Sinanaerobacter chloroacetimidivorans]MBR0598829.1 isocitrate/isopropylmalate dehydrogenase family protein [Sinanaerobacter chloroacetimidivorans]